MVNGWPPSGSSWIDPVALITMPSRPDATHPLNVVLGDGLFEALQARCRRTGEEANHVIREALADALDLEHHTIFQVSTAGALVQGVYKGCVTVAELLQHGDFGLGTFDGLDGEGILLDGVCWQACSDGRVQQADARALAPFWVLVSFQADRSSTLDDVRSWADLTARLDQLRDQSNLFVAIRVRGVFERLSYRVACKAEAGEDLVHATDHQACFELENVAGTLVGFWTPTYARTINVPGYHLHFLSEDLRHAGHVLELQSPALTLELHCENHLQLVLPETAEFLQADLSTDPGAALAKADGIR